MCNAVNDVRLEGNHLEARPASAGQRLTGGTLEAMRTQQDLMRIHLTRREVLAAFLGVQPPLPGMPLGCDAAAARR